MENLINKTSEILKIKDQIKELQDQHHILGSLENKFNKLVNDNLPEILKSLRKGGIEATAADLHPRITKSGGSFNDSKYTEDSTLIFEIRGKMTGWLKPTKYDYSYSKRTEKSIYNKANKISTLTSKNFPLSASITCNQFSLQYSRNQSGTEELRPMVTIVLK